MKILIAGGTGFVGRGLSKYLSQNHELTLLTRSSKTGFEQYSKVITWDKLSEDEITKYDIVINLCGYNIGQRRWNKSVKQKIVSSRVEPTKKLIELIGEKEIWLINASAIGYYNFSKLEQSEDEYIIDDNGKLGFSQEIVDIWEKCLIDSELKKYSILRFGVVIGKGGVLEKMLSSTKFGFVTILGEGHNIMSWISIHDLARAIAFIIENNFSDKQTLNLTAPHACLHMDFVKQIQKYLAKKYTFKMPDWLIKMMFGQMGEELLLSSQNIKPNKLEHFGFEFEDDQIYKALERYLT